MTFLSRLVLNSRSRKVRLDLANCHDLHSRIMSAFPYDPCMNGRARAELGVLYRVDSNDRIGDPQLLVQSEVAPDWGRLPDDYLSPFEMFDNPDCKPIDGVFAHLQDDQVFMFRLRANPTKRITKETASGIRKSMRVELTREEDWMDWMHRKGVLGGFQTLNVSASSEASDPRRMQSIYGVPATADASVPDVRTSSSTKVLGCKPDPRPEVRERMRMTFGSVLFEGRLRVTDADLFRDTLRQGIGSGKAYGFGLLSIAPAS